MTLSILWFILVAVLWTVYLILEGFDFGVGMLLPFVAKGDRERTQAVRTIGPHWDGNEVWLLTAGGATFAAFPEWYATMFSGMYLALFLILVCLAHGAQFLALKTTGDVRDRANAIAAPASIAATVLAAAWLMWGQFSYTTNVLAWIPLVVAALAIIASTVLSQATLRREGLSFVASAVAIAGTVAWVFASMAPAVQKSSINPAYSLTIDQASSTTATLTVMTIVTVCLLPIVLAYVIWSYWTFRSRVGTEDVTTKTGLLMKKIRLGENFLAG